MSNIYLTEPPTAGKVLIHTTYGDIDIELWSRETPLACRNFIQLALEGYYDNTIIHRVIKGFMLQMGDPTGTGEGGTSIWGKPFKDELHGRIKFNHRGQIAMANENKPHSNNSQFFVTLDPCAWLNGKHTIFGKITGDTIYNALRMGEVETNGNDRPLDEIKVLNVEVLWNPFDDIVPRATIIGNKQQLDSKKSSTSSTGKQARRAIKDTKLLSFADEDEEEAEEDIAPLKKHSMHESNISKDSKFKTVIAPELLEVLASNPMERNSGNRMQRHANTNKATANDADDADMNNTGKVHRQHSVQAQEKHVDTSSDDDDEDKDQEDRTQEKQQQSARELESQRLRAGIAKSRRAVKILLGETAEKVEKDTMFHNMTSISEAMRQKYKKRKVEGGDRQNETLHKLGSFTQILRQDKKTALQTNSTATIRNIEDAPVYHGQVLDIGDDDDEEGANATDKDWHQGKLKFKRHIDDDLRLGADGRRLDDIIVTDTRRKHPTSSSS